MPKLTSTDLRLKKLKRLAHKLAKDQSIPKHEALQKIAESEGFDSWFNLKKCIISQSPSNEPNLKRPFAHELPDDTTLTENCIGIDKDEEGRLKGEIKESHLNFVGKKFVSATAFRNELEHSIKDVISRSKKSFIIVIKVYIDTNTDSLIQSSKEFFDSILYRFDRVEILHVTRTDEQPFLNDFVFQQ